MTQESGKIELFVSLEGNDEWSGTLPEPSKDKSDGPLASMRGAMRAVGNERHAAKFAYPATVWLRGGRYHLRRTWKIGPYSKDIRFAAYKGEEVAIDGGVKIEGWEEAEVNGVRAWKADIKEIVEKHGHFNSFFGVDGRRPRTRLPKEGFYWMEDAPGTPPEERDNRIQYQKRRFVAADGDVQAWKNITETEIVVVHWWVDERRRIASFEPSSRMVTMVDDMHFPLVDDLSARYARYYVENVYEALVEPGQWYLDKPSGTVYYVPRKGEKIGSTQLFAGALETLVKIDGAPDKERFVEGISFEGICFEHGDWRNYGWGDQAACAIGGAIVLEGARNCAFLNCTIRDLGLWAIEVGKGCNNIRIEKNTFDNLGCGAIRVSGGNSWDPRHLLTGNARITDNSITRVGRVYHRATAVHLGNAFRCDVMHNLIRDGYYTGISVGWVWGFSPSVSCDNRIEKNHIHQLGQGYLSDMGGVYLLGVAAGTTVRGNLIHDVQSWGYGGWGIYPDEGSSHLVVENNVVYDTTSQSFHLHYGRESAVRNNIWAFGGEGLIAISRGTRTPRAMQCGGLKPGSFSCCFTFERNIVITDGQPLYVGGMDDLTGDMQTKSFISDLNVFHDVKGKELFGVNAGHMMRNEGYRETFNWEQIQEMKYDLHSVVADPKCKDIEKRDFTLAEDSPAFALGFVPIDLSDVGPRG